MTRAERYRQFKELRDQGLVYREIADITGTSTSTVCDVLLDPSGEQAQQRKMKRSRPCKDCGQALYNSGSEPGERCQKCQHDYQKTMEGRQAYLKGAQPNRRRWSDFAILEALRSIATDGHLTIDEYRAAYATRDHPMPSEQIAIHRFGGWNNARRAAGLIVDNERPSKYAGSLTQQGAILAVQDCADELGRPPTYNEYMEWARRCGCPSGTSVRNLCGTWTYAIQAAFPEPDELAEAA